MAADRRGSPGRVTPGRVTDDTRIRAALPTIEALRHRGERVVLVLISDAGSPTIRISLCDPRPNGWRADLGRDPATKPGETNNDPELVSMLAVLADLLRQWRLGTAHRAHASTEDAAHLLPHAAADSCGVGLLR